MHHVNRLVVILAAALPLLLAGPVMAQTTEDERILEQEPVGGTDQPPPAPTEDDELDEQVFYSGMGIAQVDSGFANLEKAINLQVVLGFRIPTVKWFGIEFDLGQTIIPGENTSQQQGIGGAGDPCFINPGPAFPNGVPAGCTPSGSGGEEQVAQDTDEFAMQALGLSAVLKSTGRFYVSGKYGYRYLITSIEDLDEGRSGKGLGAGVGYRWGKGLSGVELNYQELSDKVDSLNLTFFVRFGRRY